MNFKQRLFLSGAIICAVICLINAIKGLNNNAVAWFFFMVSAMIIFLMCD
jgi:hypothetical protein